MQVSTHDSRCVGYSSHPRQFSSPLRILSSQLPDDCDLDNSSIWRCWSRSWRCCQAASRSRSFSRYFCCGCSYFSRLSAHRLTSKPRSIAAVSSGSRFNFHCCTSVCSRNRLISWRWAWTSVHSHPTATSVNDTTAIIASLFTILSCSSSGCQPPCCARHRSPP